MGVYVADHSKIELLLASWSITPFSGTSVPTDVQVDDMITEYEATLNSILHAAGYDTPITDSTDILTLSRQVAMRVAAEVWLMLFGSQEIPYVVKYWIDQTDKFIKGIQSNDIMLVNTTNGNDEMPDMVVVSVFDRNTDNV